jgi:membrane protease YdiL (CAAX protease family)
MTLGFFVLVFAMTWSAWIGGTALAGPQNDGFFGAGGPLFRLGVFAPAVVALALTARTDGRAGVQRLLGRIGRWQVAASFYIFAVSYMLVARLSAAVIQRLATGAWPELGDEPWVLMLGAIVISTWVQAGEEIGWRGFALPRLTRCVGLGAGSILLGVIWALWHLPLFFLPNAGSTGQSFPLYISNVTAVSVAMAWLYWKTNGSLFLVMLMHASINNLGGIIPARVPGASAPWSFHASFVGWTTTAVCWAIAVPLLIQMRRVKFL